MNKKPDYLILINGENKLPDNFENEIKLISVKNCLDEEFIIERKAYEAFMRLREVVLKEDNLQIELISVYRSIKAQEFVFNKSLEERGEEITNKYVAKPGHSEHHTGFALDVSIVTEGKLYHNSKDLFTIDNLYKIIHKKLPEYGFILRYPEGKEDITKIAYEPWHFRYLDSPEIASEITSKGMCFEEYRKKLKNKH